MKLIYHDKKTEEICTNIKKATKLFGGNKDMAMSLFARLNALAMADTINDIRVQPQFHFHKLTNKGKNKNYDGYFAIYVKGRINKWRIIIQPLNDEELPFEPCNIDLISCKVKIVEIKEVSNHYE